VSVRRSAIGFGVFAAIALLVTWVMWGTLQRGVSGATHHYTAVFSNVLGLAVGDDVRIAGVRVGRVDSITLDSHDDARVGLSVQSDQSLYGNTKVLVRYQNLIGQRYLALETTATGPAAELPARATIPLDHTEPSFDISELLGGFEPLFQLLDPAQVNQLSGTLIQALQGDNVSLTTFVAEAAQVATEFSQRDAIIGEVIDNLSGVMTGLAQRGEELTTLIQQTQQLVSGLYAQGRALEASTDTIATAADALVALVDRVEPKLQATQTATTDALALLIGDGARLDRGVTELTPVLTGVARWTGQGAYANAYACTLDVSLWGILLPQGILPQVGGSQHTVVCR
jgi:phospholipid/cholesterol/gamma-HCH transport system substrate-binding protein